MAQLGPAQGKPQAAEAQPPTGAAKQSVEELRLAQAGGLPPVPSSAPTPRAPTTAIPYNNPILQAKGPELALAAETYRLIEGLGRVRRMKDLPTQLSIFHDLTSGNGGEAQLHARLKRAFASLDPKDSGRLKDLRSVYGKLMIFNRRIAAELKSIEDKQKQNVVLAKEGKPLVVVPIPSDVSRLVKRDIQPSVSLFFTNQVLAMGVDGSSKEFQGAIQELGAKYFSTIDRTDRARLISGLSSLSAIFKPSPIKVKESTLRPAGTFRKRGPE